MGGTGSQPGCELHLRSMSLINLQPALSAAVSSDTSLTAHALGNFSSLLWFFGIDRMSDLDPRKVVKRTSSSLGKIVLYDVAIMVSPFELQIIRALLTNATGVQNLLSNNAMQLLMQQIYAANYSVGSNGNVLLLEGDISLSTLALYEGRRSLTSGSAIPGDVLFPTFNWFGISGRNVILTASNATISSNATFGSFFPKTSAPQDSPIIGKAVNPYTDPSALIASPSTTTILPSPTPSSTFGQWQLALVISLPLAGALAIMVAFTAWFRHSRRRQKEPMKVCQRTNFRFVFPFHRSYLNSYIHLSSDHSGCNARPCAQGRIHSIQSCQFIRASQRWGFTHHKSQCSQLQ